MAGTGHGRAGPAWPSADRTADGPGGRPVFAFRFQEDGAEPLLRFEEVVVHPDRGDGFDWVHLDLSDPASRRWLSTLPIPADIRETVAEPVQRGRLFATPKALYGHLRDIREQIEQDALPSAGSLCIFLCDGLVVTGRRRPLCGVQELRRRVEAGLFQPPTAFSLLTGLFDALNDVGFETIEAASERLRLIEADLLRRRFRSRRDDLVELRSSAVRLARDMAYKRSAMVELAAERLHRFPEEEVRRFRFEIERYAALVEDCHEFADQCQFVLDELRAQVAEETNRNLYVLTIFSVVFLPATLLAGFWGMNVGGIPMGESGEGFWEVTGLVALVIALNLAILRLGRFF